MDINTQRICVYCGSSNRVSSTYLSVAHKVGEVLGQKKIGLVYGGGNVGLMKAVADGCLSVDGEVLGVIPKSLESLELSHPSLTKLFVTQGMHERKALMAQLSDGFVALPGGFGTMEEVMEALTWSQINVHSKPIGVLNINGFYDGLIKWVNHAHNEGFISNEHRKLMCVSSDIEDLLKQMKTVVFVDLSTQI